MGIEIAAAVGAVMAGFAGFTGIKDLCQFVAQDTTTFALSVTGDGILIDWEKVKPKIKKDAIAALMAHADTTKTVGDQADDELREEFDTQWAQDHDITLQLTEQEQQARDQQLEAYVTDVARLSTKKDAKTTAYKTAQEAAFDATWVLGDLKSDPEKALTFVKHASFGKAGKTTTFVWTATPAATLEGGLGPGRIRTRIPLKLILSKQTIKFTIGGHPHESAHVVKVYVGQREGSRGADSPIARGGATSLTITLVKESTEARLNCKWNYSAAGTVMYATIPVKNGDIVIAEDGAVTSGGEYTKSYFVGI